MASVTEIKKLLNKLYETLDFIERQEGKPENLDVSLRELFKVELQEFFMYLAASDGRVSLAERDFMNKLFDVDISTQNYVKLIDEHDIYSEEFEERLPITLSLTTGFDKKMQFAAALANDSVDMITPLFLRFYVEVGKMFVGLDGVEENEKRDLKIYLNNIVEGVKKELQVKQKNEDNEEATVIGGKKKGKNSTNAGSGRKYMPSIYKVGVDIPEGEYKVYPTGDNLAYFAICTDANCDDIIRNDNFYGQAYINVTRGQFLDLTRCYAVSVDEAPLYDASNGVYEPGEYKVGIEIPAGEYRLRAFSDTSGYYAIELPQYDGDREILSNDNFSNAAYVSVKNGQILALTRCQLFI